MEYGPYYMETKMQPLKLLDFHVLEISIVVYLVAINNLGNSPIFHRNKCNMHGHTFHNMRWHHYCRFFLPRCTCLASLVAPKPQAPQDLIAHCFHISHRYSGNNFRLPSTLHRTCPITFAADSCTLLMAKYLDRYPVPRLRRLRCGTFTCSCGARHLHKGG